MSLGFGLLLGLRRSLSLGLGLLRSFGGGLSWGFGLFLGWGRGLSLGLGLLLLLAFSLSARVDLGFSLLDHFVEFLLVIAELESAAQENLVNLGLVHVLQVNLLTTLGVGMEVLGEKGVGLSA